MTSVGASPELTVTVVPFTELTDPLTPVSLTPCRHLPAAFGALTVTAFAAGGGSPLPGAVRDIPTQIPSRTSEISAGVIRYTAVEGPMTTDVGPFFAFIATVLPEIELTSPCVFTVVGVGVAGAEDDGADDSADCDWVDVLQDVTARATPMNSADTRVPRT